MPATTPENRPARSPRWLTSVVRTASQPLPALPFDRANRARPASLAPVAPARSASVAAR